MGLKLQKLTRITTLLQKFPNIFVITLKVKYCVHYTKNLLLLLFLFYRTILHAPECPGKGACEPILVLVNDHEALDLLDLVPEHIHQLLDKLSVPLILQTSLIYPAASSVRCRPWSRECPPQWCWGSEGCPGTVQCWENVTVSNCHNPEMYLLFKTWMRSSSSWIWVRDPRQKGAPFCPDNGIEINLIILLIVLIKADLLFSPNLSQVIIAEEAIGNTWFSYFG